MTQTTTTQSNRSIVRARVDETIKKHNLFSKTRNELLDMLDINVRMGDYRRGADKGALVRYVARQIIQDEAEQAEADAQREAAEQAHIADLQKMLLLSDGQTDPAVFERLRLCVEHGPFNACSRCCPYDETNADYVAAEAAELAAITLATERLNAERQRIVLELDPDCPVCQALAKAENDNPAPSFINDDDDK